jgi:hypothetical protein
MRCAASEPLFVEQYLPEPVEAMIASRFNKSVDRRDVIEVGNLVSTQRGASQLFFIFFAALAQSAGFRFASFAATRHVQKMVTRLGFVVSNLGAADPAMLGEQALSWGTYYRTSPAVLLVDVAQTSQMLMANPLARAAIAIYANDIKQLAAELR